MSANDIFADVAEVADDLFVQEQILHARARLIERLGAASRSRDEDVLYMLRTEVMQQFCEFFYLLKARGIEDAAEIDALAEVHNQHVDLLLRDPAKMKRLSLRKDRLLDAIFTADTRPRLIETWAQRPGALDQSNLARFLVTVMSSETCRKLVVASAEAGFLERLRSPYGPTQLRSTGVMEEIYGGTLRDLRHAIVTAYLGKD